MYEIQRSPNAAVNEPFLELVTNIFDCSNLNRMLSLGGVVLGLTSLCNLLFLFGCAFFFFCLLVAFIAKQLCIFFV